MAKAQMNLFYHRLLICQSARENNARILFCKLYRQERKIASQIEQRKQGKDHRERLLNGLELIRKSSFEAG
jgi:hypothetical protein